MYETRFLPSLKLEYVVDATIGVIHSSSDSRLVARAIPKDLDNRKSYKRERERDKKKGALCF
jgi:hypothetical protein